VTWNWLDEVAEGAGRISDEDDELVRFLAGNILERWRKNEPNNERLFEVYAERKEGAQGVIYAILEVVNAIGQGWKAPTDQQVKDLQQEVLRLRAAIRKGLDNWYDRDLAIILEDSKQRYPLE